MVGGGIALSNDFTKAEFVSGKIGFCDILCEKCGLRSHHAAIKIINV